MSSGFLPLRDSNISYEIVGSQFVEVANAGHLINMDNPETFDETVEAFLSRL